jgi:hypothetical protein
MPRPPVKKTMRLSEASETGRLKAQYKMEKKKPLEVSLREHIGKLIDNVKFDPLEIIAVIGTTVIVHDVVMRTPEIVEAVAEGKSFPFAFDLGLYVLNQLDQYSREQSSTWTVTYQERKGFVTPEEEISGLIWKAEVTETMSNKEYNDISGLRKIKILKALRNMDLSMWEKSGKILKEGEFMVWIVCFALAYIVVHNAGQLIGLLQGGLDKAIPFLLGV